MEKCTSFEKKNGSGRIFHVFPFFFDIWKVYFFRSLYKLPGNIDAWLISLLLITQSLNLFVMADVWINWVKGRTTNSAFSRNCRSFVVSGDFKRGAFTYVRYGAAAKSSLVLLSVSSRVFNLAPSSSIFFSLSLIFLFSSSIVPRFVHRMNQEAGARTLASV